MTDCPTLRLDLIRARIEVAGMSFGTPGCGYDTHGYINSFSLNQSRGQVISTLNCQLEIWIRNPISSIINTSDGLGPTLTLWAGVEGGMPQIFTGYVKSVKGDPHFNDSRKYYLSITAEDVFTKMRNKKYSRRFKTSDSAYALIRGGQRKGGGRMTQLRRVPTKAIRYKQVAGTVQDTHSPLQATPDPKGWTPNGRNPQSDTVKDRLAGQYVYTFHPSTVSLLPGQSAILTLYDEEGNPRLVGLQKDNRGDFAVTIDDNRRCSCFVNPNNYGTTNSSNVDAASGTAKPGELRVITSEMSDVYSDETRGRFIITMRDWYPFRGVFVDPATKALAKIDAMTVAPHGHDNLATGGPAGGIVAY